MFVKCFAGAIVGIKAIKVDVEVNVAGGGIGLFLVGLPDNAIKESEQRIRSAFENSQCKMTARKVVVNLAPADLRKEGSGFDLPIAVGILAATSQILDNQLADTMFVGELSLDGKIKPVHGVLPLAVMAKESGLHRIVVAEESAHEASVVEGLDVVAVSTLRDVVEYLNGDKDIAPVESRRFDNDDIETVPFIEDFADVKGQGYVKRALEIAAAGGHNVLMIGAPGSGKTMLARRMPTIMPPMTLEEAVEATKIHSVAGKLGKESGLLTSRPFRAPHHLTSQVALIGGGQSPQPGEVSLAHNGILFLDELPEFGRNVLEVLRQPLEDRNITISRAKYSVEYPSSFTLIAAMNPCPCGYYNHPTKECSCQPFAIHRYFSRISGPLLDRIDMHIEVTPVPIADINADRKEETSAEIRKRVVAARKVQSQRFKDTNIHSNAMMNSAMLREFCPLQPEVRSLLERAMERLSLSARAYDRIIKVARTIADLAGEEHISASHIAEAINYRTLDRDGWGK